MTKIKGDRWIELTLVQEGGSLVKRITGLLLLILLAPCLAFADLAVHFLDVRYGDSAIIICDGQAMIIDGGLPNQSSKIFSYLQNNLHQSDLKYVIATHPDKDHIGGLSAVLQKEFNVQNIYSPVTEYDSEPFNDLLKNAEKQRIKIKVPYNNDPVKLGGATVTIYNVGKERKNIIDKVASFFHRDEPEEIAANNDMSLVVRIVYKDVAFLFTGDIEAAAEQRLLLDSMVELSADVLKVAHHGSRGSSTYDFLEKVNPTYAIISCGKNNTYKHPSAETLKAIKDMDIELFRTDLQGDITFKTDGKNIEFSTIKDVTQDELYKAPQ